MHSASRHFTPALATWYTGDTVNTSEVKPKSVRMRATAQQSIERALGGPLPQVTLALRWHTSQASVSRWLRGTIRMPMAAVEDLSQITSIPVCELIAFEPESVDAGEAPIMLETEALEHWIDLAIERKLRELLRVLVAREGAGVGEESAPVTEPVEVDRPRGDLRILPVRRQRTNDNSQRQGMAA